MPELMARVLATIEPVAALAREIAESAAVLFLGRHVGYPVALEGALKLKELAYMHAEGFPAGELKHGPIALIEDGLPVVVVMPSPGGRAVLHDKMLSNIPEIRARGACTIVIAEEGDDGAPLRRRLDRNTGGADPVGRCVDHPDADPGGADGAGPRLRRRQAAQSRQVGHRRVADAPVQHPGRRAFHRRLCRIDRAVRRWRCRPPKYGYSRAVGGDGTKMTIDVEEIQSNNSALVANVSVYPGPALLDPLTHNLKEDLSLALTSVGDGQQADLAERRTPRRDSRFAGLGR